MNDAEALETFDRLGREHRRTVVREQRARERALLERLRDGMHEGLGGLVEVPLGVAAEARAIVEHAEQLRGVLVAGRVEDRTRALVEVQVPEAVDVGHFVRARLARHERLAVGLLSMTTFARAQQALAFHEAAERRVAGDDSQTRILAGEREQVVVMKLELHRGWSRCWRAIASASAWPRLGCVPACPWTLRASTANGSEAARAMYHQRSIVLNEKRIDSPVVG